MELSNWQKCIIHNGRVLLKAGYLKNIRPATEPDFENEFIFLNRSPFENGRSCRMNKYFRKKHGMEELFWIC